MSESTLYILRGLPFAGKTTLAKELVKRFGLWIQQFFNRTNH
jgi:tRNA uridine 5-carbamoylmethylation protein Kti12